MEKVVENVYTYLSARNLIQNDFWMRSEKNPSFSLRSYSQNHNSRYTQALMYPMGDLCLLLSKEGNNISFKSVTKY